MHHAKVRFQDSQNPRITVIVPGHGTLDAATAMGTMGVNEGL